MFSIEGYSTWPKKHHCACQATRHVYWNNCVHCGQILCKAHGPGPKCSYCGKTIICEEDDDEEQSITSKKKIKHREPALQKAIEARDRLIQKDRPEAELTILDEQGEETSSFNSIWIQKPEPETLSNFVELSHLKPLERLKLKHDRSSERSIKP